MKNLVLLSYILTFSKLIFLAIGIFQLISRDVSVAITIGIIIILDILDGGILELVNIPIRKKILVKRQIFNALIDRLIIHVFIIVTILIYQLSILYYIVVLARELILYYLVSIKFYRDKRYLRANWYSKSANIFLGLFVITVVLQTFYFQTFLIFIFLAICSLITYLRKPKFY